MYSKNPDIVNGKAILVYKNESGVGDGVCKDVYSSFFNEIAKMYSAGVFESIPSSLSGEDAVLYGKIVSHAYSQHRVFPSALAKAFFEMLIFESVRDETLIESYKNFLTVNERNLLISALSGTSLNQNDTQELWDALTESLSLIHI